MLEFAKILWNSRNYVGISEIHEIHEFKLELVKIHEFTNLSWN